MKLTEQLKKFAVEKLGVAATADEATVTKAIADALLSGKLDGKTFAELTQEKAKESARTTLAAMIQDAVTKALGQNGAQPPAPAAPPAAGTQPAPGTELTPEQKSKLTPPAGSAAVITGDGSGTVAVKGAKDHYRTDKVVAKHFKTGKEIMFQGQPVQYPSQLELAKMGAFFRFKMIADQRAIGRNDLIRPLDPHEKELVAGIFAEEEFSGCKSGAEWYGDNAGEFGIKGPEAWKSFSRASFDVSRMKADLLDDTTSGGQGLAPIFYDDLIITFPLLYGEIFPYLQILDIPRGVRMVTGSLGNPTVSWGTAEGTAITVFDATALAAEVDSSIYPVVFAIRVGIDFLSDAPMNVGEMLQKNVGMAAQKEFDNVACNGNGTTQPQGIFVASGTTTYVAINGAAGPLTVDDLSGLVFSLSKQYRVKGFVPMFAMNDVMYRQLRDMPVSPADQRRVLGLDYQSYQLLEYPCGIQQQIPNGDLAFFAAQRYRMYRRKGFDMRTVTEGITLALSNEIGIVGRARLGGKVIDGAGVAVCTSGPTV